MKGMNGIRKVKLGGSIFATGNRSTVIQQKIPLIPLIPFIPIPA